MYNGNLNIGRLRDRATTREFELNAAGRIILQKESCHGYHSDKAEEEEEDDENVTRSDLVSEVVPLTS